MAGLVGPPDAVLATSVDAWSDVPFGLPAAVWVDDAAGLTSITETDEWQSTGARLALSADPVAISGGAMAVPRDALVVRAWPPLAPLVRARWRERLGLPPRLVVAVGSEASAHGDGPTNLALAAAAVVTGPLVATALALGTPLVTSWAEADRLGLRAGREVELSEPDSPSHRDALAQALAADDQRAARCSVAARRFAESTLDLDRIAGLLLERLSIGTTRSSGPLAILDRRLAELGTPRHGPVRSRVAAATAALASSERS